MDTATKSLLDGLRFDIFERVHLADKIEGIRLIESVELTPNIKVTLENDQVIMLGNLLLKIEYIGDVPFKTLNFEHSIPVEITIPANRVINHDLVDADIENFNVDRLNGRVVSVTGVLKVYEKEQVRVDKPLSQERLNYDELDKFLKMVESEEPRTKNANFFVGMCYEIKRLQAIESENADLKREIEQITKYGRILENSLGIQYEIKGADTHESN